MILKFKKGFSLVELLVVIAIIGILAAVGITAYQGYTKGAKEKAVLANQKQIVSLINAEFAKCASGSGSYPWGAYSTGTTSGGNLTWGSAILDNCDRQSTTTTTDPADFIAGQVSALAISNYINYHLELKNPWNNTDTTIAIVADPGFMDPDTMMPAVDPGWTVGDPSNVGRILLRCGGGVCTIASTLNKEEERSTTVSITYY
jgi:prepilin-type N-terminal cleavage/methylation domain-containing protein